MKKFLVLYMSSMPAAQMSGASREQGKTGMELWMAWAREAQPHLIDPGARLGHPLDEAVSGAIVHGVPERMPA